MPMQAGRALLRSKSELWERAHAIGTGGVTRSRRSAQNPLSFKKMMSGSGIFD